MKINTDCWSFCWKDDIPFFHSFREEATESAMALVEVITISESIEFTGITAATNKDRYFTSFKAVIIGYNFAKFTTLILK